MFVPFHAASHFHFFLPVENGQKRVVERAEGWVLLDHNIATRHVITDVKLAGSIRNRLLRHKVSRTSSVLVSGCSYE